MTDRSEPTGEIKPGQVMPLSAVPYGAVFLLTSEGNPNVQGKIYRRADNATSLSAVSLPFGILRQVEAVRDESTGNTRYEDVVVDNNHPANSAQALADYDVTIVSPKGAEYKEGIKTYQEYLEELRGRFIEGGPNSTEFAVFSLALDCEVTEAQARQAGGEGDGSFASDLVVRKFWLKNDAAKKRAGVVIGAVPCLADSFSEATELIRDAFFACREENPNVTFPIVEAITQLEMWRDHVVNNIPDASLGTFCPKP
jgi:hypothetical protein